MVPYRTLHCSCSTEAANYIARSLLQIAAVNPIMTAHRAVGDFHHRQSSAGVADMNEDRKRQSVYYSGVRLTEPLLRVAKSKVRTMLGCSSFSPKVASSSFAFEPPFMPVWWINCKRKVVQYHSQAGLT
jgi:hypothetical protein